MARALAPKLLSPCVLALLCLVGASAHSITPQQTGTGATPTNALHITDTNNNANAKELTIAENTSGVTRRTNKQLQPWLKPYEMEFIISPPMNANRLLLLEDSINKSLANTEVMRRADARRAVFFNQHEANLPKEEAVLQSVSFSSSELDQSSLRLWLQKQAFKDITFIFGHLTSSQTFKPSDTANASLPISDPRTVSQAAMAFSKNSSLIQTAYLITKDSDLTKNTVDTQLTQVFFGELSSVSMGFSRSWGIIKRFGTAQEWDHDSHQIRLGLQQIITARLKANIDFQHASEKGFLENPYRSAVVAGGFLPEALPRSRVSRLWRLGVSQYLDPRSVLKLEYTNYNDTWSMNASSVDLIASHHRKRWIFDVSYRQYSQQASNLYSPNASANLSTSALPRYYTSGIEYAGMNGQSMHFAASYTLPSDSRTNSLSQYFEDFRVQLSGNYFTYDYNNYSPLGSTGSSGTHKQTANLIQFTIEGWF